MCPCPSNRNFLITNLDLSDPMERRLLLEFGNCGW